MWCVYIYIYIFNRYFEMISSYCTQLGDPFQLEMKIKKHIKNPPRSRLQPVDLRLQIWLGQGDGRCSCQGDSQTLLQGHSTLRRLNHTDQGHGRQFQENLHPQVACHWVPWTPHRHRNLAEIFSRGSQTIWRSHVWKHLWNHQPGCACSLSQLLGEHMLCAWHNPVRLHLLEDAALRQHLRNPSTFQGRGLVRGVTSLTPQKTGRMA